MTVYLAELAAGYAWRVHRRFDTFSRHLALRSHGIKGAHRIPTFTTREELDALYHLAQNCPSGARVLEIGSYLGASTCFIAAGLRGPGAKIVCVDTWRNQTMPEGERDTLAEFERNVVGIRDQLTLIRKASSDVRRVELDGPFDLMFLDGDHSYQQTRADFGLVSPLLTPTGTLAFHDSLYFEGVSRVVGEALATGHWQLRGVIRNLCWIRPAQFEHPS